ncbi:MAG: hypothetical protein AB1349_03300 [Elusimicrobiota bacterium]
MVKKAGYRVKDVGCSKIILAIGYLFLFTTAYTLLPTPCLYGYTSLGYNYLGDVVCGYSARSLAMGCNSITVSNDSSAIFTNPAALTATSMKYCQVSVSNAAVLVSDRYTNNYGLPTVKNNPAYYQFNEGSISAKLPLGFYIAGGRAPVVNYSYRYSETIYDRTTLEYENKIDSSGDLWTNSAAIGWKATDRFSVGLTYNMLNGERESSNEKISIDGNSILVGYLYETGQLKFGGYYRAKATLNLQKSTETIKIPEGFGFGFSYQFRGKLAPLFTVETNRMNWKNVKLYNTTDYRVGFEQWLYDYLAIRYGFYTSSFYYTWDKYEKNWEHGGFEQQKIIPRFYTFTVGSGFKLPLFDLDFGYEFGKRSSAENVNVNYKTDGSIKSVDDRRVDETIQRIIITARYRW